MASAQPPSRQAPVVVTGLGVTTAFGRGPAALLDGVMSGRPAFRPVTRFDTERCRVGVAAELPGEPKLGVELAEVIGQACDQAGLDEANRADTELLLALHTDQNTARDREAADVIGCTPAEVSAATGVRPPARIYVTACAAASTAIADAAASISSGRASRLIVAAGYLVDADSFWLFDAGRALAADGQVRPFSAGRRGMLLGDGVAAVVLEDAATARSRGTGALAGLAGWGRAGDAYHVVQPRPDGTGLARAISSALDRAGVSAADVGYINANATGTAYADASEAAAIHLAFGPAAGSVPVSSTKSVHGHALEASALVEFAVTVLALRTGLLPINAGFLAPDDNCELDLVLRTARRSSARYGLSLNAAFGGANTALLVEAA
ncbi:MAG TPA: beta-ketoacyl synthase N-terminal-like domain-containing protein [Streptosporangiaceae bacterium]|nr:beta-ketoacyl synthase N-terminal-like domain-containing protein [Streptosporangiaceae bacterium]